MAIVFIVKAEERLLLKLNYHPLNVSSAIETLISRRYEIYLL